MSIHPQDALQRMIAAFEAHYHAALSTQSASSPHLAESEQRLRDAFFTYDDALFNAYGVDLPFDLVGEDDEDDYLSDDDDLDDDDDEYDFSDDEDDEDYDEDDFDDDFDDDLEIVYLDEDLDDEDDASSRRRR